MVCVFVFVRVWFCLCCAPCPSVNASLRERALTAPVQEERCGSSRRYAGVATGRADSESPTAGCLSLFFLALADAWR